MTSDMEPRRPMPSISWIGGAVAGALAFCVVLALELPTLLPGLAFWDTAEFQTIGPVLGIAHPTGYPSYTLLLWVASVVLQPFGDEAFRANLLSALLIPAACGLTAVAVVQLTHRAFLGLAAGVALGLAPTVWRIGLRADPHPLHLALTALLLVLLLGWAERSRRSDRRTGRWLIAAAAVFGVALGNHALTLLLVPGIAVFVLLVEPRMPLRRPGLVLLSAVVAVAITLLLYAYLPLRSAMDPPLDYANPETWEALRYVVLGEQFRGTFAPLPPLAEGIAQVWSELWLNLGPVALVAVVGFVLGAVRWPRVIALTGLWFAATFIFALGYLNADIGRYYVTPFMIVAVWAALGGSWLLDLALRLIASQPGPRARRVGPLATAVAAVLLLAPAVLALPETYREVDASDEREARVWLDATFAALERDAVIISWWSYSTPLWYGQFVEGSRSDVLVIDDRTILDQGLGTVNAVIDQHLGHRPVYVIRLFRDLVVLTESYRLERVEGVPISGEVWRVVGQRDQGG